MWVVTDAADIWEGLTPPAELPDSDLAGHRDAWAKASQGSPRHRAELYARRAAELAAEMERRGMVAEEAEPVTDGYTLKPVTDGYETVGAVAEETMTEGPTEPKARTRAERRAERDTEVVAKLRATDYETIRAVKVPRSDSNEPLTIRTAGVPRKPSGVLRMEAAEQAVLAAQRDLEAAHEQVRKATRARARAVRKAVDAGCTRVSIARALGVSHVAVVKMLRSLDED